VSLSRICHHGGITKLDVHQTGSNPRRSTAVPPARKLGRCGRCNWSTLSTTCFDDTSLETLIPDFDSPISTLNILRSPFLTRLAQCLRRVDISPRTASNHPQTPPPPTFQSHVRQKSSFLAMPQLHPRASVKKTSVGGRSALAGAKMHHCHCTDHLPSCQLLDQLRHKLILIPSVAQRPLVSIPQGEELPRVGHTAV
jgi:hypothetical protein